MLIPTPAHETPLRRTLSGSLAGIASVFVTYPLEVIRVRLAFETKLDKRSSLSTICSQIYHERPSLQSSPPLSTAAATPPLPPPPPPSQPIPPPFTRRTGMANFYRGFSPTLAGMLPYAGTSFLTHDTAIDLLRHPALSPYTTITTSPSSIASPQHPPRLKSWAELLAGGVAGLVSQTASYPLEVIRRRMQVGGAVGDGHRLRMGETARLVWAERGFRGFWVGLGIGYFKVVPMAAVSFFVYERGKRLLGV